MIKSEGSSSVAASLGKAGEPEVRSDDRWTAEAGLMLLNGLMRIFSSGNIPAEIHVDPSRVEAIRTMDLVSVVERHVPEGADRNNLMQVAQWWSQNRERLSYTAREGFLYPVVISQSEQAEAEVFSAVLQHLQSLGLERALNELGIDVQTLMKSPKLFQDTVWFQFQFMLHERLNQSKIIVPGAHIPDVRL